MALAGSAPKGNKRTEKMPGGIIQGVAIAKGNDVNEGKDNYAAYQVHTNKVDHSARSKAAKDLLSRGNP